jgi:hypothetical protein
MQSKTVLTYGPRLHYEPAFWKIFVAVGKISFLLITIFKVINLIPTGLKKQFKCSAD